MSTIDGSADSVIEDLMSEETGAEPEAQEDTVTPDDTIEEESAEAPATDETVTDETDATDGDSSDTETETETTDTPAVDLELQRDLRVIADLNLPTEQRLELSRMDAAARRQTLQFLTARRPEAQSNDSAESDEDRIAAIAKSLMPSASVLKEVAESEGMSEDGLAKLTSAFASQVASVVDQDRQKLREFEAARQQESSVVDQRETRAAIIEARDALAKDLPFVDDAKFNLLLDDPFVEQMYTAEFNRTGDRRKAMNSALMTGAMTHFRSEYANHIRASERGRLNATSQSRKNTSDRGRGASTTETKPNYEPGNVDSVMEAVFEEVEG